MKKNIEYIASGCSYMRLQRAQNSDTEENRAHISEMLAKVSANSKYHKFGLLFNAFTEQSFGPKLRKFTGYDSIHADSGGLQIITQGKQVTAKIKDEIYLNQCASADFAMCFDEIPIGMHNATSGRNDVTNRWFQSDMLEHYARETGRNIARQIEVFIEDGKGCKPILIAQGNCYDTYMRWVDYVMDEIPQDHHKYMGAVAMGAAALGTGTLEDIERAFIFGQLQIPTHHLHILGVGSAKRLLPYLALQQSGAYKDVEISYDSTTHTGGVELGNYYGTNQKQWIFTRQYGKIYEQIFEDISTISDLSAMNPKSFHKILNTGFTDYIEGNGLGEFEYLRARIGYTVKSISNFVQHVDQLIESKENLLAFATEQKMLNPIKHMYSVKTKEDFDAWMRHFSRSIKSKRIASGKPASLEDCFT